jgi:hypothetical protein
MNHSNDQRPLRRRRLRPLAAAVLATAGAAGLISGAGVATASASSTWSETTTIEAFREAIKPWDSITIPSMSCPPGSWLKDVDVSPGRGVPRGVEITGDSGAIGTTITAIEREYVTDGRGIQYRPVTGTTSSRGISTATNWDPFASHELVINLHCTTNLYEASQAPR